MVSDRIVLSNRRLIVSDRIRMNLTKIGLTLAAVSITLASSLSFINPNVVLADIDDPEETASLELTADLSGSDAENEEQAPDAEETEDAEVTEESSEEIEVEEEGTAETSEEEESDEPDITEETSEEIEVEDEADLTFESVAFGVYYGITIDGDFYDWDSVVKAEGVSPEVNACAVVWDGDYLYLYMNEAQQNSASWSGPRYNGNFVIRTDLEEVMIVSFDNNGAAGNKISVTIPSTNTTLTTDNGGIDVAFNEGYSTWGQPTLTEIAIPTSAIPDYLNTLSFGYYLGDTFISDIANLNPDPTHDNTPNDGSSIVIDGDYRDWHNYPVTTIQYETAGTEHNYADAKGAIYSRDGIAYVYGVTNNFRDPNHWAYGNQFLEVTLFLGDQATKMVAVLINPDGTLDWDASKQGRTYEEGTYHFALFEQSGSAATTSLDNIAEGDIYYGDMYMTVGPYQDRTEFWFDVGTVAEHLGVDPSDAGIVKVKFHRIGREMLETSGISTGPVFVLLLASTAAGSYYIATKKRKKTE